MSDPRQYTVGWICATTTAYTASRLFLDKVHDRSDHVSANDNNHYTIGEISGHRVVIAVMPDGEYGPGGATAIAEHMLDSFPDIRVCLTVGIGGGASIAQHDIRLGDIVVGVQHVKTGNVSQYDYGKTFQEGSFRQAGFHDQVPKTLRTAISKLRVRYAKRGHKLEANVTAILNAYPEMRQRYSRPTHESDRLYKPDFVHPTSSEVTCEQVCGKQNLVSRSEREEDEDNPAIHYGVIASADQPMKDATTRDTIAQENGVMCFETEAAGLMNSFPCLIVRGICDYSDSHKSAEWQGYAAMTAAAYTKDLLRSIVPSMIEQQQNIREITIEQQQNIRDVTVEHQENIRNTDVEILRMQENSRRIAEWLSAPDTTTNHHRALQQHFDDTGLWFIHGDAFKKWKSQPGSFLWLHGSPGCGKTVLTSTIIEHLMQGTTHQVLLYFYFDFRDTNQQSLDSVLRSLATQLYRARPEASRSLYHLWASHEEGNRQPSTESLHNALQSMLNMVGSVSIILDALDESTTRHELLAWLRTLVKSKTTNCRLLVTSRRDGEIASALQSWTRAQDRILIQANEVNKDIRAYVKDRVCNGDELGRWHSRPDVLEEVELVLMEKADGMFRWVACQIEALGYCLDYRRLRAVLEGLPEGLDETYAQILGSISEDHRQIANTILGLLIWSLRPLRLKEMVDAIAVDLEASPTFDPRNRMSDPRDVLRSCQGLVILSPDVETTVGEAQEQDQQFELAHFSVRDYLLSGRVHASIGHCMNRPFANAQIAKICLAYLSSIAHSSSSEDMRLQYPFVRYSASYWADHVRLAEDTDHVLSDIVVALQAACSKGPDGVVKILLDGGADVNAQGGEYGNALQAASANGHVNILKILLGKGADINARSGRHGTALHAALLSGSYEMVQTLLGMGADVNAQDEDSRTVLHQASQKGLDQIVQILLEYGAEIDVRGGCEYDTALQLAALEGHREIVQILVNHGADINAQSNTHGTALQIASEGGHESIVRILLDSGAHVTVADQPTRANEHHEGHSNVAYSAFHDSGYSSHQTQPMVDDRKGENLQPMDDDNASVGTVDVDIQSSAESLPLSNVREAAAREVARAFIEDDEISNLYDEGLERMDNAGFIENHRRLLKLFYLEATKDAKAAAHHVVLRFLRSRIARIRVSARIIEAKEIPDEEIELAMNRGQSLQLINGILTQADKKRDTSHWTEELQSGLYEQTDMFPGYGESTWTSLAYESSTSELPADELDDDEDFDASKEEEADPRENYLPALVNTRAFLMGSRAFRIYRSNLQRFAHGKHIAPTAFRIALLADDLALAIELLENESEAITQFRLGFEWIKEPLAMGFTPSEVVRLIIQRQEDPSYKDDGDQAIGAGRWNQARGLLRGEEPRASHKRLINEHLIATDRPAVDSSEQLHDPVPRLEHVSGRGAYDLSENIFWKYLQSYLMTQYAHSLISSGPHVLLERRISKDKLYLAVILAIPKRMMSRAREFMIYSGLILGPLEPGHTRITWKSKMGHTYTSDVKQLKTGGISNVFGSLKRFRGIKIVSMGNTTHTAGNSFWTNLINKVGQWTSKKTKEPLTLPQQTPVATPTAQPQRRRLSHTQAGDILMICMQRGKRSKNIYQEDLYVRNIDNDQELFVFFQQMFVIHRGALRSYLSLRTIKELKLVEFRLPKNRRPFIPYVSCPSNTCRCLPPEDRILPLGAEYRCTSSGGGGDICPPVPAHVLTDYYENPDSVDPTDTWLLELMPKRICGRLEGKSTEPAQGWGISYEEGWDHEKIGLILLVVFFGGSLLFGVFWTVFKHDIQGAFGVSAWWLGASTILLGYVAIRADDG